MSTNTPADGGQILLAVDLPPDIPPPKFSLFEVVKRGNSEVELTGTQWIDDAEDRGWWYSLSNETVVSERVLSKLSERPAPNTNPVRPDWKERCKRHQPLLNALSKKHELIFLHAIEDDFCYLDVKVEIEERLNVPLINLLGNSLSVVAPEIAEPRRFWLKRALETCCSQSFGYSHDWEGMTWRFECQIAPLWGSEEILVVTTDAAAWQHPWWNDHLSAIGKNSPKLP